MQDLPQSARLGGAGVCIADFRADVKGRGCRGGQALCQRCAPAAEQVDEVDSVQRRRTPPPLATAGGRIDDAKERARCGRCGACRTGGSTHPSFRTRSGNRFLRQTQRPPKAGPRIKSGATIKNSGKLLTQQPNDIAFGYSKQMGNFADGNFGPLTPQIVDG